ncbi:hypothetical protein [Breoghania sp. L-A4]|uniref:hypothetical protein n=1 Tax=Breoghania sp. L-A4 TaxID=2304600 RepID=UPI000E3603CD|nr:hypothetical protein [Breoghania sp. L-A4]AXS39750.1 hypothetical protein D1F64_06405 [Breoghania sp. L-A4]
MRLALSMAAALGLAALAPDAARANDYPTEVVADYVFGCMAANAQTRTALRECSCSIDVLSTLLSYEDYSMAETVLRMRQVPGGGEKMALFRETPFAKTAVDTLRRAQVEAEVRCFR